MIPSGTTPTLRWRFKNIPIEEIEVAYLTIQQDSENIIEKTLGDAKIEGNTLLWTLTQEDTLKIKEDKSIFLQVRYRTRGGYSGKSPAYSEMGDKLLKGGVI